MTHHATPAWNAITDEYRARMIDLLENSRPYTLHMVRRVPKIIRGRWPWSKPRHDGYTDEVSAAIPADIIRRATDQYTIGPTRLGAHWDWIGEAEFRHFLVYANDGTLFARGGRLSATPFDGATIKPELAFGLPITEVTK